MLIKLNQDCQRPDHLPLTIDLPSLVTGSIVFSSTVNLDGQLDQDTMQYLFILAANCNES